MVSRGECVEIGGGFRIPEVMEQSGAQLVDVGTTNRTRLADYSRALARKTADVAAILKVHPSNYRVEGFVESTSVDELATLGPPVVADIGSGLIDATCPWLPGPPPAWLHGEPAARQTLHDGAALVTFSGDKLLGGPQAGIIAGRADLVAACAAHPLCGRCGPARTCSPRCSGRRSPTSTRRRQRRSRSGRWSPRPVDDLHGARRARSSPRHASATSSRREAVPGAGSAPGTTIPSIGIRIAGDHLGRAAAARPPIIARARDGATWLDLRTVDPTQRRRRRRRACRRCA